MRTSYGTPFKSTMQSTAISPREDGARSDMYRT